MFDSLLQLRVTLAHDLIQLGRLHAMFLQLLEGPSGLYSLMLASVSDQHNAVFGIESTQEFSHLPGARERSFIDQVQTRRSLVMLDTLHQLRLQCPTEGLRMELHSQNIRCTMISPGAIATELSESSSDEATRKNLREFMKMAIPASAIARAIAYAIEQPAEVEVDEMVIRPTVQDF